MTLLQALRIWWETRNLIFDQVICIDRDTDVKYTYNLEQDEYPEYRGNDYR